MAKEKAKPQRKTEFEKRTGSRRLQIKENNIKHRKAKEN